MNRFVSRLRKDVATAGDRVRAIVGLPSDKSNAIASSAPPATNDASPMELIVGIKAAALLDALGGRQNIDELAVCANSRLRVSLKHAIDHDVLGYDHGVFGVVELDARILQLVIGNQAEAYVKAMNG